jgi:hypothetical protein
MAAAVMWGRSVLIRLQCRNWRSPMVQCVVDVDKRPACIGGPACEARFWEMARRDLSRRQHCGAVLYQLWGNSCYRMLRRE